MHFTDPNIDGTSGKADKAVFTYLKMSVKMFIPLWDNRTSKEQCQDEMAKCVQDISENPQEIRQTVKNMEETSYCISFL